MGPFPPGHFASKDAFKHLIPGKRYRVARRFTDFDDDMHMAGEAWTFLGSSFLPYDDGLSLFVSPNAADVWQIRLQCRSNAQGKIVDALHEYVVAADGD